MADRLAALAAAALAAGALAASPVVVRLRVRSVGFALLRPRATVWLLWGLIRLRPALAVPRWPLRALAGRMGLPVAAPARARAGRPPRHPVARPAATALRHLGGTTPAARYLFAPARRVTVRRLRFALEIGAGDPARTALACGAVWAPLYGAAALLGERVRYAAPPHLALRPLFTGPARLRARLDCILAAPAGHVILAAAHSLWATLRRRPGRSGPLGAQSEGGATAR
jgi:hypothetical protein